MSNELGVNQVTEKIGLRLRRYIEAQYHIRDSGLIRERESLLLEPGTIAQLPYVEATPSYEVSGNFKIDEIPALIGNLLDELSALKNPSIGVFPPYHHQADALKLFFGDHDDGQDLVVATGTGSGKTETFLYPLLGSLALEGNERPRSYGMPAVRALLLYPMNALVSDQTARLRRLLRDPRLATLFKDRWGRQPRFGMYTGRTPYPGVRKGAKDERHLEPLFAYYESLEQSQDEKVRKLVAELKKRGKWPAKDVIAFFARHLEEPRKYEKGKKAGQSWTKRHWLERFLTQPDDRELVTRHEMLAAPPDLLITNYSMLEYMLLRPVERPIFELTKEWLAADKRNRLLLVLDEAHMYRGVAGAEVGLLIRRLISRLDVTRERVRCILTSASLGKSKEDEQLALKFARGLTGERSAKPFALIRGRLEQRSGAKVGTAREAKAVAKLPSNLIAAAKVYAGDAQSALERLAIALDWQPPPNFAADELAARQHVARCLTGFGPFELLIKEASGNATRFDQLAQTLFPGIDDAEPATDALFALGSFSRRIEPSRSEQPLLPARCHMMYLGLPPLYACINASCLQRRAEPGSQGLLGRFFTRPRTRCACGGRVFELLTHRDCGAAYVRAFAVSDRPTFLWHERGGTLTAFGAPLNELHLLVEQPDVATIGDNEPVRVDVQSGRVVRTEGGDKQTSRLFYRSRSSTDGLCTFETCPICKRETKTFGPLKIMDLATKGEQPFANLVREQFVCQPLTSTIDEEHPNGGRKALLFSDGRQKAARLARDLPREVERDSFREAVVLACRDLANVPGRPDITLDSTLYTAFVAICAQHHLHFFDQGDQRAFLDHCRIFTKDFRTLETALDEEWDPSPGIRFRRALLRQISDPYYSLVAACAAVVVPREKRFRNLERRLEGRLPSEALRDLTEVWIGEMLRVNAFDPDLPKDDRQREFPWARPVRRDDGMKQLFDALRSSSGLDASEMASVREALFDVFTAEGKHGDDSGRLLVPNSLVLRLTIEDTWLQCADCGHFQPRPLFGACGNHRCGSRSLEERRPDHPYVVARKGFFREPLLAVLRGAPLLHLTAEEHTAQLSQRDSGVVYATTEEFELRFQDIPLSDTQPPVDVLSCTTTMEVGIDIGALTAVSLRTVPPQRENYQQRAGRAGRRGVSLSTVITFAQGGSHDAHYFANPQLMISGEPRKPRIKSNNKKLAQRHVNSHLLQTFFHDKIAGLSKEERELLDKERPGIMSAFGAAEEFFEDGSSQAFSHDSFDKWLVSEVLAPASNSVRQIAAWLPEELELQPPTLVGRERLVREFADALRQRLQAIKDRFTAPPAGPVDDPEDDQRGTLLDLLFDRGLLPSYAFPTDLCSFFIQEWGERSNVVVKERPQLAKAQALSEYAPGRLLVVNKETYRVGGVFAGGPPTSAPATGLFAMPLRRYIGCTRCTYVSLESGTANQPTQDGAQCPTCWEDTLVARDFLDPPGFSPEKGRATNEGDRDQDITYASTAQLPELLERGDFTWATGPGKHMSHAYGVEVPLVVSNKGRDEGGFSVCETCGAATLGGELQSPHPRPFKLPDSVRNNEHAPKQCAGPIRNPLYLGHEFRTDVFLLRVPFQSPVDFSPNQPWIYDALASLAEAVGLGATLHLDIDPGDLSTGFRLLPSFADEIGNAELFLYDTAAGGAGYAAEAGEKLEMILKKTAELLTDCRCERSCTDCLRHYGNRFLHGRLDRHLALALLQYAQAGEIPAIATVAGQRETLRPLSRFLELEGWQVDCTLDEVPLRATGPSQQVVNIGTCPALLEHGEAQRTHPLRLGSQPFVILPDYLVAHDLPSAYRVATGSTAIPSAAIEQGQTSDAAPHQEVRVQSLEEVISGSPSTGRTVRIPLHGEGAAFSVSA